MIANTQSIANGYSVWTDSVGCDNQLQPGNAEFAAPVRNSHGIVQLDLRNRRGTTPHYYLSGYGSGDLQFFHRFHQFSPPRRQPMYGNARANKRSAQSNWLRVFSE
jgi:hypothetical protein